MKTLIALLALSFASCAGFNTAGFTTALRQQALVAATTYQATGKLPSGDVAKAAAIAALIEYLSQGNPVPAAPPASVVVAASAAAK